MKREEALQQWEARAPLKKGDPAHTYQPRHEPLDVPKPSTDPSGEPSSTRDPALIADAERVLAEKAAKKAKRKGRGKGAR